MEEWKPVKGYEGKYEISNTGQTMSLNYQHTNNAKILKPVMRRHGYFSVMLYSNGAYKHKLAHRLVAETFVVNVFGKKEVNHKNGIKTDNHYENLEWVTPKENIRHSHNMGLQNHRGESNGGAKLTEDKVREIRKLYSDSGMNFIEISKIFNISKNNIGDICRRNTWKHI